MLIVVGLVCAFMLLGARGGSVVPGRLQSLAEMAYEFIAGMLRSAAGEKGMRFFPMVFSIFMFVLLANLIGLFPYSFTVTSHLIVTAALALLVFVTVIVVGLKEHGLHFFKLFVPSDVPIYILPLVVAIEVFSFFVRPVSHSVRLFANMLAGHITLYVFGAFVADAAQRRPGAEGGRGAALRDDHRPRGARTAGRVSAGLCLRHADLHVSQRRHSSRRSLTAISLRRHEHQAGV